MIKDEKAYRILVIEDNAGDFAIVEHLLSEQIVAPAIEHVDNFKQAAALLANEDALFDVILLDLSLPDQSGQQLIDNMLEIAGSCPVIILTGFEDINFSIKSISQGILDYLFKDDLNATTLYKSIIYAIERKKSLYQLKQSEKRYSDIFHLSPQPMWVFDTETFKFLQVNKATIDIYGYTEDEFMNMTLMDLKPQEDFLKANDGNEAGATHKGFYVHTKKSGETIEIEIYSNPIVIDDRMYRLVIGNDVTEKNRHEQNIIKAIIKTQEDERYEIGSELHDNVCQILATSQIRLGMLKESVAQSGIPILNQCKDDIVLASKEIRKLSHILAPAFYDFTTLEEELITVLNTFNIDNTYKIIINFDDNVRSHEIDLPVKQNIYRILQEHLGNIQKHANCTEIEVNATIHNNELKLSVTDNGNGFSIDTVKRGIGLANMKRRVAFLSGRFELESSPGNGCKIMINIPLDQTPKPVSQP